jgi:hypothetical protein
MHNVAKSESVMAETIRSSSDILAAGLCGYSFQRMVHSHDFVVAQSTKGELEDYDHKYKYWLD